MPKKLTNQSKSSKYALFFIAAGIVLLLDQISKLIVNYKIAISESIEIFPFFHLTHLTNTGAGFSILQNQNTILIWIALIIIGLTLFFLDKIPKSDLLAAGIIFGGITGNLFDRIFLGGVTDFLDFSIWPVFNIADSALTIGLVLLLINSFKKD